MREMQASWRGNKKDFRPKVGKALVILSGGENSTVALFWAMERFAVVSAITFNHDQYNSMQLKSACKIAEMLQINHEVVPLGALLSGFSPATIPGKEKGVHAGQSSEMVCPGKKFIPGKHLAFFSIAANRARVMGCTHLVMGAGRENFLGYPEFQADFMQSMANTLHSCLGRKIKIHAPLLHLDKAGALLFGSRFRGCIAAMAHTHACCNNSFPPCNRCPACLLRSRGFVMAGLEDPLMRDKGRHAAHFYGGKTKYDNI
ncbi:MAG: 7-cyano-7-deazaguanine synthase [Magnetococcales bacterium]|nr:7-cyano-7-deazaguanine synthase [Magnetococcales bacterium]MBF0323212.1 7-cyano-7-deazaguanine synthase [Magnetococcales bacterium]